MSSTILSFSPQKGRVLLAGQDFEPNEVIFTDFPFAMASDLVDACPLCCPVQQKNPTHRHPLSACPQVTSSPFRHFALEIVRISQDTGTTVPSLRLLLSILRSRRWRELMHLTAGFVVDYKNQAAKHSIDTKTQQNDVGCSPSASLDSEKGEKQQRPRSSLEQVAPRIHDNQTDDNREESGSTPQAPPGKNQDDNREAAWDSSATSALKNRCLATANRVQECLRTDDTRIDSEVLVVLLGIIQCNAHAIETIQGKGISRRVAMLEHSCNPSAFISSQATANQDRPVMIEVRASRRILKDEPISIRYWSAYAPTLQRQQYLQQHYTFWCQCSLCLGPDFARVFCCPTDGCTGLVCPPAVRGTGSSGEGDEEGSNSTSPQRLEQGAGSVHPSKGTPGDNGEVRENERGKITPQPTEKAACQWICADYQSTSKRLCHQLVEEKAVRAWLAAEERIRAEARNRKEGSESDAEFNKRIFLMCQAFGFHKAHYLVPNAKLHQLSLPT